ncbi:MAG: hypothetical protein J7L53_09560, partial [Deltaproteobacteria bacterium]|nr:hypothetical protein [Deltaproteobacteria bacterium]
TWGASLLNMKKGDIFALYLRGHIDSALTLKIFYRRLLYCVLDDMGSILILGTGFVLRVWLWGKDITLFL